MTLEQAANSGDHPRRVNGLALELLHDVQEVVVHLGLVAKLVLDLVQVRERVLDLQPLELGVAPGAPSARGRRRRRLRSGRHRVPHRRRGRRRRRRRRRHVDRLLHSGRRRGGRGRRRVRDGGQVGGGYRADGRGAVGHVGLRHLLVHDLGNILNGIKMQDMTIDNL